jgi:hypothetical protein
MRKVSKIHTHTNSTHSHMHELTLSIIPRFSTKEERLVAGMMRLCTS